MKVNNIQLNTYKTRKYLYNSGCKTSLNFYGEKNNQQISYPTIEYWIEVHKSGADGLENVETYALSNKAKFNLDKNSPDDKFAFEFHTKLKHKPKANEATKMLLARMISNWSKNNGNSIDILLWNGEELEVIIESDKSSSNETLKKALQNAYHANLTQEQFDSEKKKILLEYDAKNQDNVFKYMYGFQKYSKADIENVSLDDVKKLYSELINNSMTLCSTSVPKNTEKNIISQIKTIIEQYIPNQNPFDANLAIKQVKPIENSVVLRSKPDDDNRWVSKFYTIQDDDTLRDSILFMLIENALIEAGKKNKPQNIKDFSCSRSGTFFNKYFEIYTESEDKKADVEGYVNSTIKSLTNNTLNKQFLDKIKQKMLDVQKTKLRKSASRASILSEIYTKGSYGLKEFSSILNSITSEELQQTAQRYFSSPCITEIKE